MCLTAMPDELANYLALNLGMVSSVFDRQVPVCDQCSVRGEVASVKHSDVGAIGLPSKATISSAGRIILRVR